MSASRHELPREEPEAAKVAPAVQFTPGFVAFLGAMVLPAVLALAIYLGAWAVSDEVYAAEDAAAEDTSAGAEADVAEWKQTLVGICPIH